MAHREPEADRFWSLAVGHQFASGVVDRGNMVGVECVSQTEQICGGSQSDTEYLGACAIVVRCDDENQRGESDDVHQRDDAQQGADLDVVAAIPAGQQSTSKGEHETASRGFRVPIRDVNRRSGFQPRSAGYSGATAPACAPVSSLFT